jgi:hypothetical protein
MLPTKKTFRTSTISTSDPESLFALLDNGPVDPSKVDYRALSFRLYKALKRLIEHEAVGKWTQAPFPHSRRLGCQFCEREWVAHAPDCLIHRLRAFLKELEPNFPKQH